ncbi:SDR family NAD(P)-dependent oxidoreductase [Bordetella sp. N]|uniref:SDR family NAD(P)-dependent oxidoreductase n=1 Tax=Bordetella sp. N TaxID=1746199 RepID=UPI00070AD9DA|nr:SDR family oxidoreductase [Bordetella sp. N]ALM86032.1 3-ketoacyl-ACP reductase [Bordetella sp. N]
MNLDLQHAKVLVTGGSRGIGRAIVECFLEEGARVAYCARNAAGIEEAQTRFGARATGTAVDVTDATQMQRWVQDSARELGGIDVVVANVSALAGGGEIEAWRRAFETDLLGTVHAVNAAVPLLRASQKAAVVLISSVSGREVDMFAEPYGVMKAALIHYGKTLSVRHAPERIRVNTVSPGNVYFADGVWGQIERDSPELFAQCLAANPLGRMARPEEVARAAVFLASPAASFITGTNLILDGGLTRGVQF